MGLRQARRMSREAWASVTKAQQSQRSGDHCERLATLSPSALERHIDAGRQEVKCGSTQSWSLKGRSCVSVSERLTELQIADGVTRTVGNDARCAYTDCFHMVSLHMSVSTGCATPLPYASCDCTWLTTCPWQESNAHFGTSCWLPPSSCCSPGSSCEGESNAH